MDLAVCKGGMVSIRKHNKDHSHLKISIDESGASDSGPILRPEFDDPLRFWTLHEDPTLVDLNPFKDGQAEARNGKNNWRGSFNGRPQLVDEMAPAFRALTEYLSPSAVAGYVQAMRAFWRLFDEGESESVSENLIQLRVISVADITEVHRQSAVDKGIYRKEISQFARVVQC